MFLKGLEHTYSSVLHFCTSKEPTQKNVKSVAGAMNNYAREGRVFTRTAPNTFFLLELQTKGGLALEIPDDFGIDDEQDTERVS